MTLYTWVFEWNEGGYNSVRAATLEEAVALGNQLGAPTSDKSVRLTVNVNRIWCDSRGSIRAAYDRRYAGMFY